MRSLVRFVSIMSISAFVLSACGSGGDAAATQTVKDAMVKSQEVKSGEYEYHIVADVVDSELGGSFDVMVSGVVDSRDYENLIFSMAVAGTVKDPGLGDQNFDLEVRVVENIAYGIINESPAALALFMPDFEEQYGKKWFSFELPAEVVEQFKTLDASVDDEVENLTPQEQAIRDIILNAEYVESAKSEGSEDGMDKYSVDLDEDVIVDLMVQFSEIDGYTPDEKETESLEEIIDGMEVVVYVDPATGIAVGFEGEFVLEIDENDPSAGTVEFTFTAMMSNLGEDVELEAPSESEPFDIESLFGSSLMGL